MSRQDMTGMLVATLVAGILLTLLPLPAGLEPFRPYWVALVLIYWTMEVRPTYPLGAAFMTGMLMDLLTASLMGRHALSLVVIVYLVKRFRARMRFFPAWQQAAAVLALLVNDRIILLWITSALGEPMPTWRYWLAPLVGAVVWPWLFLLLDRVRIRRRHAANR